MITTLVAILAAVAVGGRANDALRTAQMESILTRLPRIRPARTTTCCGGGCGACS